VRYIVVSLVYLISIGCDYFTLAVYKRSTHFIKRTYKNQVEESISSLRESGTALLSRVEEGEKAFLGKLADVYHKFVESEGLLPARLEETQAVVLRKLTESEGTLTEMLAKSERLLQGQLTETEAALRGEVKDGERVLQDTIAAVSCDVRQSILSLDGKIEEYYASVSSRLVESKHSFEGKLGQSEKSIFGRVGGSEQVTPPTRLRLYVTHIAYFM
jgi:hypothetical protein